MITENDPHRGRQAATLRKTEGNFARKRKWINAIRDFRPGMEVEEEGVPIEVLFIAFLATIGAIVVTLAFGLFIIWATV